MSDIVASIKTCRTCLSKAKKMRSLFAVGIILGKVLSLKRVLTTCANLQISINDGLPQYICLPCIQEIERAFSFRIMCEKNQNILIDQLNKQSSFPADEQLELSKIDEKPVDRSYNCDIPSAMDKKIQLTKNDTITMDELKVSQSEITNLAIANITQNNSTKINRNDKTNFHIKLSRKHPCRLCKISFETRKLLIQHQKYNHGGDYQGDLVCSICDKRCKSLDIYKRHMNFHRTGKEFHCDTCGKDFSQQRTYVSHIYSHTGERPFLCVECGKTFKQNVDLLVHMRIHLNLYPYKCPTCDKQFRYSNSLIIHKRIHTGEKPYLCEVCNKGFISSRSLRMHKRLHTGVKPFICKYCGKAFIKSYALKVHSLTHTGERPHVCSKCKCAFTQAHCLRTHMRKYHSNDNCNSTQKCEENTEEIENNTQ